MASERFQVPAWRFSNTKNIFEIPRLHSTWTNAENRVSPVILIEFPSLSLSHFSSYFLHAVSLAERLVLLFDRSEIHNGHDVKIAKQERDEDAKVSVTYFHRARSLSFGPIKTGVTDRGPFPVHVFREYCTYERALSPQSERKKKEQKCIPAWKVGWIRL